MALYSRIIKNAIWVMAILILEPTVSYLALKNKE